MTSITVTLGTWQTEVDAALNAMSERRVIDRLWQKDHRLWKPEPTEIENRLGWLTVAEQMQSRVSDLKRFAASIREGGFRDVVLLGMGGSSLGPEVLRQSLGSEKGFPQLLVLDSTVPGAVRQVAEAIDLERTLFILASKSGGTIEVMSLFAYFWEQVSRVGTGTPGKQFIAITDPETSLVALARDRQFRATFINPPDIGGRYSVLSYFGLVPAALMGLNLEMLLERAVSSARSCDPSRELRENPGALLGVAMGVLANAGRDKVTLLASPAVESFGLWVEQLLAESTGKEGKGLIPIAQEPLVAPPAYGDDRLFVTVRLDRDANRSLDRHVAALKRAGQPMIELRLRDRYDLGSEFFRWEFATAVAGHLLGIQPFDQPNVQESKDNTKRILEEVKREGRLPAIASEATVDNLLSQAKAGQYVAVLAYVSPSAKVDAALKHLRKALLTTYRLATTAGYGPRYLHSTGQLHKGGANKGVFLELTESMVPDLEIPDAPYTFGTLAQAQAIGDLQSLQAHQCPVVHVALDPAPAAHIKTLAGTKEPGSPRASAKAGRRPHRHGRRA